MSYVDDAKAARWAGYPDGVDMFSAAQELQVKSNQERDQGAILAAFVRGEMRGVMMPARRISTHLSHVLLTDTRAFKLKRAVRSSLLDFSDVEQRRAACEAEFARNRHVAFYDRVLPVTQGGDHRYGVDGVGEIVDWVIVMRRFEESQQFDHLASRGALTVSLVENLAERVGTEHMSAQSVAEAGHVGDYRQILDSLGHAEAQRARAVRARPGFSLAQHLQVELASVGDMIERRRVQGRVRRGHGDLRLCNICIWDGAPTSFDAPALSERMAAADVLYDLALLLMDLHRLDLNACAEAVVRRYWAATGEEEDARALLPFFMAMRAAEQMAIASEFRECLTAEAYRRLGLRILTPSMAPTVAQCSAIENRVTL